MNVSRRILFHGHSVILRFIGADLLRQCLFEVTIPILPQKNKEKKQCSKVG